MLQDHQWYYWAEQLENNGQGSVRMLLGKRLTFTTSLAANCY